MNQVVELCRYLRRRYGLPARPTMRDLLFLCAEVGCPVVCFDTMEKLGAFCDGPEPFVALRWDASRRVLAHELWHYLTEQSELGGLFAFTPPRLGQQGKEALANEFSRCLCGD